MGVNYYWFESPCSRPCSHCQQEGLHIGKSSAGWMFALHVHPEKGINKLEDYLPLFLTPDSKITGGDETLTMEEMIRVIVCPTPGNPDRGPQWYQTNHADPGPREGVARSRSRMGGEFCDYIGDFS